MEDNLSERCPCCNNFCERRSNDLSERRHHCRNRATFHVRPEVTFHNHASTSANRLPTLVLECNLFTQQDAWRKSPVDNPSQLIYLDQFRRSETNSFCLRLCPSQYTSEDMLYAILQHNLVNWDEYYESINGNFIKQMVFRLQKRMEEEFTSGANCQYLEMFMVLDMTLKVEDVLDGRIQGIRWSLSASGRPFNGGMVPASKTSVMELPERMEIDDDQCLKDIDCVICLQQLESGGKIVCMPCSHMFHQDCIKTWLDKSHYCPICRYDLPTTRP